MRRIGKIVATHGLKGAVVFTHVAGESNWLKENDVLFLEMNKGSFIPFFVSAAKAANDEEYIVNLEDVEQVEAARKLIGKQVYVKEEILSKVTGNSPLLWIGFNVIDKQKGSLGNIEDVVQTGHQWLGKINYEGREVLIPLIEQMIVDVNVRNKFIRMDLPEGLLEI
ncbi:MAG TPA: ribosome maturation factor RimM [Flavipsychrobacter sp.]|nr:ribosome maturation factor RimM [Flavipsychrobacter sp.]